MAGKTKKSNKRIERKANRVRSQIRKGGEMHPRLSVFRSNKHIHAQIIDDVSGKTLVSASSLEVKNDKLKKIDVAKEVGKLIAKKAEELKISSVVFDRGSYRYHGRVKSFAEGAREGKLKF